MMMLMTMCGCSSRSEDDDDRRSIATDLAYANPKTEHQRFEVTGQIRNSIGGVFADQRQYVREAVSDDELLGKVAFRNQQVQEHDEAI
jgi:hypothetical protein